MTRPNEQRLELTGARAPGRNPRSRRADTLIAFIASHSV